jgi:OHCU decarboxylase
MTSVDKGSFVAEFGTVYEHSPWVADCAFEQARDDGLDITSLNTESLAGLFQSAFLQASSDQQMDVLRAHPALACKRAEGDSLSADSSREQTGAGLDQCSESEHQLFKEMNAMYFGKNGFPFIIAVKGRNRQEILTAFRERLGNSYQTELQTALRQVFQIARFRIGDILSD